MEYLESLQTSEKVNECGHYGLCAHLGSNFSEINCPQADEKARLGKNKIGRRFGCLENVLLQIGLFFSPQESAPDSCHSFSFK
jgi:hypothetical protein